jgi:hypothetical protein
LLSPANLLFFLARQASPYGKRLAAEALDLSQLVKDEQMKLNEAYAAMLERKRQRRVIRRISSARSISPLANATAAACRTV